MTVYEETFPHIEWEWLYEPAVFKNLDLHAPIALHVDKLTLQRDPDYALYAIIEQHQHQVQPLEKDPFYNLSHSNRPITLSFTADHNTISIELSGCVCIHARQLSDPSRESAIITLTLFIQKVGVERINLKEPQKVGWMTEWFLNGISEFTLFRGRTDRQYSSALLRQRTDLSSAELLSEKSITSTSRSVSPDFFPISYGQWKIFVTEVPDGIGPTWSINIGIEYSADDTGSFPSDQERDAIAELVSFFFGKQLVRIGSTTFDENGNFITRVSQQKMGYPYPQRFHDGPSPPDVFPELGSNPGIGERIAELLPRYLQLRADIGIDEILYNNLWQADKDPLGSKIPTLVTGIENLAKRWFASQQSPNKGVYIPKREYESLIAPEMVSLKVKFEEIPDGEKVINKINSAFQMSTSDRFLRLLTELNLPIGEVEEKVFRDRNKYSHGHILSSDEEINTAMKLSSAARSLFNRIFLRMLNYQGTYIDYYLEAEAAKSLDEPVGS